MNTGSFKQNKTLRAGAVLVVVALITLIALSFTFAKYVSQGSGQDNARVAKWGLDVQVNQDLGLFSSAYKYNSDASASTPSERSDPNNTVKSSDDDPVNVVAPGTYNKSQVVLVTYNKGEGAYPEVMYDLDFTLNIEPGDGGESMVKALDDNPAFTWGYIDFKGQTHSDIQTAARLMTEINGLSEHNIKPNSCPSCFNPNSYTNPLTIFWNWDFDNKGAGTYDETDTSIGNASAYGKLSDMKVSLGVVAKQTQGSGPVPPTPTATLSGSVVNEANVGISGATVSFNGKTTTTNNNGSYSFTVDKGTSDFVVSATGYDTYTESLTVSGDTTKSVTLTATPTPSYKKLKAVECEHGSIWDMGGQDPQKDITSNLSLSESDGGLLYIKPEGASFDQWFTRAETNYELKNYHVHYVKEENGEDIEVNADIQYASFHNIDKDSLRSDVEVTAIFQPKSTEYTFKYILGSDSEITAAGVAMLNSNGYNLSTEETNVYVKIFAETPTAEQKAADEAVLNDVSSNYVTRTGYLVSGVTYDWESSPGTATINWESKPDWDIQWDANDIFVIYSDEIGDRNPDYPDTVFGAAYLDDPTLEPVITYSIDDESGKMTVSKGADNSPVLHVSKDEEPGTYDKFITATFAEDSTHAETSKTLLFTIHVERVQFSIDEDSSLPSSVPVGTFYTTGTSGPDEWAKWETARKSEGTNAEIIDNKIYGGPSNEYILYNSEGAIVDTNSDIDDNGTYHWQPMLSVGLAATPGGALYNEDGSAAPDSISVPSGTTVSTTTDKSNKIITKALDATIANVAATIANKSAPANNPTVTFLVNGEAYASFYAQAEDSYEFDSWSNVPEGAITTPLANPITANFRAVVQIKSLTLTRPDGEPVKYYPICDPENNVFIPDSVTFYKKVDGDYVPIDKPSSGYTMQYLAGNNVEAYSNTDESNNFTAVRGVDDQSFDLVFKSSATHAAEEDVLDTFKEANYVDNYDHLYFLDGQQRLDDPLIEGVALKAIHGVYSISEKHTFLSNSKIQIWIGLVPSSSVPIFKFLDEAWQWKGIDAGDIHSSNKKDSTAIIQRTFS